MQPLAETVKSLHRAVLPRLDPDIRPRAEPNRTGIVHLGLGAFHRAHQAVFTEDAMAATGDDRWGICGIAPRSRDIAHALRQQDNLYTVSAGAQLRVLGALTEVLHGEDDAAALLSRIADPHTAIVSLTVTEKAYRPGSALIDLLVRGLRARREADAGPLTVLSCDNIVGNGPTLAGLVEQAGDFPEWLSEFVRFPSSVVDRIVPASTAADRASVAERLGYYDAAAVLTEPYREWILAEDFAAQRPAWETAGARFVTDVAPYERRKLRLLNGSHSALAYLGGLAGTATIAEAVREPALAGVVRALMAEVAPTLAEVEIGDYPATVLDRFANPELRHTTAQVAADGSQKLPQRLLGPARELCAAGREPRRIALAVAAWIRYLTAEHADDGGPLTVHDPLADRLRQLATRPEDAADTVRSALRLTEVFGADLAQDTTFIALMTEHLDSLIHRGALATAQRETA